MSNQVRPRITAEPRQAVHRRSELKRLRRSGQVPASLFGHGEPENICIPAREMQEYLRHHAPGGLLDLNIGGQASPTIIREIERHPVTGEIITLGFQRVDLRETLRATVPLEFHGEAALIANGYVLMRQMDAIEVHARADALPEMIDVDVSGMAPGDSVRIGDLQLPQGVEATKDHDLAVLTVSLPTVDADVAAALDAEEAAHAALVAEHHAAEEEAEEEEAEATTA